MRLHLLALTCLLILAAACSDDEDRPPTPTLFPELEASPGPTVVPPPVSTQGLPQARVASTVWVIEAATGDVTTLYEDFERPVPFALMDDDPPSIIHGAFEGDRFVIIRRDFDGAEIEREDGGGPVSSLLQPLPVSARDEGCEIDGRLYQGVPCGQFSPNARWMTYADNLRDLQPTGRAHDLWVLDIASGETRLLQEGIVSCTQCDGGSRFAWSSSGNHLMVGEASIENRLFIIDVEAGSVRVFTQPIEGALQWSPTADLLARPDESGRTILDDVAGGNSIALPDLRWPARFDHSGRLLYASSRAFGTTIIDVETGDVVAELREGGRSDPSAGPDSIWHLASAPSELVAARGDGFVAAVAIARTVCDGTAIYVETELKVCVEDAGAVSVSPGGAYVVAYRKTGETGQIEIPWLGTGNFNTYEVILVDVAAGQQRVVAEDVMGWQVPYAVWNAEGTHLVLTWPYIYGP